MIANLLGEAWILLRGDTYQQSLQVSYLLEQETLPLSPGKPLCVPALHFTIPHLLLSLPEHLLPVFVPAVIREFSLSPCSANQSSAITCTLIGSMGRFEFTGRTCLTAVHKLSQHGRSEAPVHQTVLSSQVPFTKR